MSDVLTRIAPTPYLVCQQKADSFQRLLASVYIVTKEEVIRFWRETTIFK
jgi:hypothetical protein